MRAATILLVDDNVHVRRVMEIRLAGMGHTVVPAATAHEALAVLEGGAQVDLMLTDVVMPGELSGIDLARAVAVRWPTVRILLISGFPGAAPGVEDGPSFTILAKPVRKPELERAVREALAG